MAKQKLIVGSLASFTSKRTGAFFQGTVYFYRQEDASFGIDCVLRADVSGRPGFVEGCYQFLTSDIEDLRVVPFEPNSTINDTEDDDQKNKSGDALSSSTVTSTSKCVTSDGTYHCINAEILQKLTDYMFLEKLLRSESKDDALVAFQIVFLRLSSVIDRLPAPKIKTGLIEAAAETSFLQMPPDITLQILARIPKYHYPIVSCVAKDLHNLLKSRELHNVRRQLDKEYIFLCFTIAPTVSGNSTKAWFTLRKHNDKSTKDVFVPAFGLPTDEGLSFGNIFALGSDIVLVEKKKIRVLIYDSRSSTLRQTPNIPVDLNYRNSGLVGHKLYVFGTPSTAQCMSERYKVQLITFDFKSQTWDRPYPTKMRQSYSTATVDKNIYLIRGLDSVYYHTREGTCFPFDLP
ncbi:PREDICTED: F-box/kelch-repeat protein At2g44630-like [Camelina sativa]|uniref:F-box/kelch-repeat protein At2g44630-like n=1 Tax=Camelina sativa TaxID=90675 RepID=A0ABM0W3D7_CAMSA|nr:PREDICTED: F-box/kelch-repeat protein At2g44630-like [Camelina sativa]